MQFLNVGYFLKRKKKGLVRKIIQFNNAGKEFLGLVSFLFLETGIENI